MNDEVRKLIQARIAQLGQELATFIEDANRQIAAQQGAIQALELLLGDLEKAGDEGRNVLRDAILTPFQHSADLLASVAAEDEEE